MHKLTDAQMASFVARGFLRFDAVVPDKINKQFLGDIGHSSARPDDPRRHYENIMRSSVVPLTNPGTPLNEAYAKSSAVAQMLDVPEVRGAIDSLVGQGCVVDHHFLHITFPEVYWSKEMGPRKSQPTHQDSTIDPRQAFDVQLFYFPHEVTIDMGGTRFIPGSHLRLVSEAAISRYQNIRGQQHVVCPAGSVFIFHMGLWHGGGLNRSDELRYMFKIRLCPTQRQLRLWQNQTAQDTETSNVGAPATTGALKTEDRPIFWTDGHTDPEHLFTLLTQSEPWFEADTGRLEYVNRIRFWRYLTGDDKFDADYWLTRLENDYN